MKRWQDSKDVLRLRCDYKVDKTRVYASMHEAPAPAIFTEQVVVKRRVSVTKEQLN